MTQSYPHFPEKLPGDLQLKSGHYVADFARSPSELEEVQRLRFAIFNLEMGEGLDSSYETQMDIDEYDAQCHHLIIRDSRNHELVGTYRMQCSDMAASALGFYSDDEYHLEEFPPGMLDQSLELGRACISKDHRSGRVLFLLWRGLFTYLKTNELRYMFGCCSLTSQDPTEGWAMFERLKLSGNLHPDFLVNAREHVQLETVDVSDETILDTVMPRLMRLYIDYGTLICSLPAIDRAFKTIDFLVLLDMEHLPQKMMKVFKEDI